jgi:hypothetical protein
VTGENRRQNALDEIGRAETAEKFLTEARRLIGERQN